MNKWLRYILIVVLIGALMAIRLFEYPLFYDPLAEFFRGYFKGFQIPAFNIPKFTLFLVIRFLVNTALSLGIIYLLFQKKSHLIFSGILYGFIGVIGVIAVLIFIQINNPEYHMLMFYTRRVLIQPLLLFIIVPALFFQERTTKAK